MCAWLLFAYIKCALNRLSLYAYSSAATVASDQVLNYIYGMPPEHPSTRDCCFPFPQVRPVDRPDIVLYLWLRPYAPPQVIASQLEIDEHKRKHHQYKYLNLITANGTRWYSETETCLLFRAFDCNCIFEGRRSIVFETSDFHCNSVATNPSHPIPVFRFVFCFCTRLVSRVLAE